MTARPDIDLGTPRAPSRLWRGVGFALALTLALAALAVATWVLT